VAVAKRTMAGGSVIELSNYLEQRISQKSAEYAAVSFERLNTNFFKRFLTNTQYAFSSSFFVHYFAF